MNWQELMKVEEARQMVVDAYMPSASNGYKEVDPPKIPIAILDDGCDSAHPQLKPVIIASHNFETKGTDVKSQSSHGTLSAGLAAGVATGQFLGGVAQPERRIVTSLIVAKYSPDSADDQNMFTKLCTLGARVISCSWGYGPGYFGQKKSLGQKALRLKELIQKLSEQYGVVFVFAAGNEGKELAVKDVQFAEHAILVAATLPREDAEEVRSNECNYGPGITVCAPGGDSTGLRPVSTCNQGKSKEDLGSADLDYHANTSAACPMVAGVAALVLATNPKLTAKQVKTILCETADPIDTDTKSSKAEWTVARAVLTQGQLASIDEEIWGQKYSPGYGFGRVNAEAAVARALKLRK